MKSDKRLFIQILHFLLVKIGDLKKRYYLGKYLNPATISDEFNGDEEISELVNKFKELQTDFSSVYQMAEERRQMAPVKFLFLIFKQVKELKSDIQKLQSDKVQLTASINNFKKTYSSKKDFIELFETTSKLRKEQEEDSNLDKRLLRQQYDIEDLDERILISRQRQLDLQRNLTDNLSALELLESLRNSRNNNRDTLENLSKYEIIDKRSKIKSLEEIIISPEITFDELNKLKREKANLSNDIDKLDIKVKQSASKTSELTIYKQNSMQAASNKESALKIVEKLEKEKMLIDGKYGELEKKFENSKGYKYVKKDDLLQQAENVKRKKDLSLKNKKILDAFKGESLLYDRTINLIKFNTDESESIIKQIESKYSNVLTTNSTKQELEALSRQKAEIDLNKEATLEEYSNLIQQIRNKIEENSNKHAPMLEQRNQAKKQYEEISKVHESKKQTYDLNMGSTENNFFKFKEEYNKTEFDFRSTQNSYHSMNINLKINECLIKRYESEISFNSLVSKSNSRLNDKYKTYQEYYDNLLNSQNQFINNLKDQQRTVKDNYEDSLRQVNKFLIIY